MSEPLAHFVEICLDHTKIGHMMPDQYGAFVAWVMKIPNFYEVKVKMHDIHIVFCAMISDLTDINSIAASLKKVHEELDAFLQQEPYPCPCGCGAYLMLSTCFRQAGDLIMQNKLSAGENEMMAKNPNDKISIIKAIRQRTGLGLKDAKDLFDQAFDKYSRNRA